jgi:hypothetical protein
MADQNINNMTVVWNAGGTTFNAIKMNVTDTASAVASSAAAAPGRRQRQVQGRQGRLDHCGRGLSVTGNSTITGNLTVTGTLTAAGIAGSVTGPASSVDNTLPASTARSGGVLQGSGVTVDDSATM